MSENDSVILSQSMYNKLYAYRFQYEEYNFSEQTILRKLFSNLFTDENKTPQQASLILKEFYHFNSFQITQSEIYGIIDECCNLQDSVMLNLPPSLQTLFTRFPILRQRINLASHNINTSPINQTQTNTFEDIVDSVIMNTTDPELDEPEPEPSTDTQVSFSDLPDYPSINNLRISPIISNMNFMNNIVNNNLVNHGILNTSPANILFVNNPNHNISLNFGNQILNSIMNNIDSFNRNNEMQMDDVPIVLKQEVFDELPKNLYKDLPEDFKKDFKACPISMQDYEDDTELVKLPCNHYFSVDSAKTWLLENSHKCPVCRASAGDNRPKLESTNS